MEDQEIGIMTSYAELYANRKEADNATTMETPLSAVMSTPFPVHNHRKNQSIDDDTSFCDHYEDIHSQPFVHMMFAQIFDKRTWKRRLLIITTSMLLVMKRPYDHYLKNAFYLKNMKPAVAVLPKKEVSIH